MNTAQTPPLSPEGLDLQVQEVPLPAPGAEIRGAGQDLFQIFRTDLLERFLAPEVRP